MRIWATCSRMARNRPGSATASIRRPLLLPRRINRKRKSLPAADRVEYRISRGRSRTMSKLTLSLIILSFVFIASTTVMTGSGSKAETREPAAGKREKATFAGGGFWCMEAPFDTLPGVGSVTVGDAGGGGGDT